MVDTFICSSPVGPPMSLFHSHIEFAFAACMRASPTCPPCQPSLPSMGKMPARWMCLTPLRSSTRERLCFFQCVFTAADVDDGEEEEDDDAFSRRRNSLREWCGWCFSNGSDGGDSDDDSSGSKRSIKWSVSSSSIFFSFKMTFLAQ